MKLGLMLSTLLLTGCSTIPEPINTSDDTSLRTQGVANNPEQFVGQQARWGGVMLTFATAKTTPLSKWSAPLKSWGRPTAGDDSDGRFLALIDGFIDPAVYEQARKQFSVPCKKCVPVKSMTTYTRCWALGYYLWKKEKPAVETQIDFAPLWFRHNFMRLTLTGRITFRALLCARQTIRVVRISKQ